MRGAEGVGDLEGDVQSRRDRQSAPAAASRPRGLDALVKGHPVHELQLTPEAERMFLDSFAASRSRYEELLDVVRSGRLDLADTDLDTGGTPAAGVNPLADATYRNLLANRNFAGVSPTLSRVINEHLASGRTPGPQQRTRDTKTTRRLAALNGAILN